MHFSRRLVPAALTTAAFATACATALIVGVAQPEPAQAAATWNETTFIQRVNNGQFFQVTTSPASTTATPPAGPGTNIVAPVTTSFEWGASIIAPPRILRPGQPIDVYVQGPNTETVAGATPDANGVVVVPLPGCDTTETPGPYSVTFVSGGKTIASWQGVIAR